MSPSIVGDWVENWKLLARLTVRVKIRVINQTIDVATIRFISRLMRVLHYCNELMKDEESWASYCASVKQLDNTFNSLTAVSFLNVVDSSSTNRECTTACWILRIMLIWVGVPLLLFYQLWLLMVAATLWQLTNKWWL